MCGEPVLTPVLSLTPTPPANAFVRPDEASVVQECFPLDVFLCESCGHVQLLDVVDPTALFAQYVYVSGTSPVFVKHFQDYAAQVIERSAMPSGALVVDIGSNDGTLLRFFRDAGMRVLGIDPAEEIARTATRDGIETVADFFTPGLARRLRQRHGRAAAITANNVMAHVDDLAGVVEGVRELLAKDGVFVFEVSYLVDVYEKTLFDMTYHEHLDYHTVGPLAGFFERYGMRLVDVVRVDTHGGSIRGFVRLAEGAPEPAASVGELIGLEERIGLDHAATFRGWSDRIGAVRDELTEVLSDLRRQGKRVAGFGAPAKATTLMHHFALGPDIIEFIVDDSPLKQGLLSPGFHIPVLPATALYERRPDYLLVLAWNFAQPIMAKHSQFAADGGRFIVPLPEVVIRP